MRLHPSRRQHEELIEIIRDYSSGGASVELQVYLGDLDLTDLLEEGDLSVSAGSSPAWTFSGTFADRLDVAYRGAPLKVIADIGGIELEIFNGLAALPVQNDDFSTQIIAGTPGIFLDKVTLDANVGYNNATPQSVIRDAVYRVAPYDRGRIYIPEFDTPLINRGLSDSNTTGSADSFADDNHPMDILTSLQEEVDYLFYDTAYGRGFRALPNPGVGEGQRKAWDYEAKSKEVLEPFAEPTFSTPDEQYFRVVLRDRYEDGTLRIWEEWPVDYSGLLYPPPAAATLYMGVSDTSADAYLQARKTAAETARKLRSGTFGGALVVAFHPLYEPYDVIHVHDERVDLTGRKRRHWQCLIEGISHRFSSSSLDTELSYTSTLISTELVPDTRIVVSTRSAGVASTPISGFVLGLDYIGEWVDAARITGPVWSGEDATGDWFDPDLAPTGLIDEETVNGELLDYIDYLTVEGATHGEDDLGEWVDDTYISDPRWSGTDFNADGTSLDWFDFDYAPLGLLGEDGTGEYIDF